MHSAGALGKVQSAQNGIVTVPPSMTRDVYEVRAVVAFLR